MESNPKFHDFQNHTCADAVVILTNYIPYKIITLDNYYNEINNKGDTLYQRQDEIQKIKDKLRIELEEFIEVIGMLRIWAALSVPKLDEVSFKSDVQKQVFGELKVAKSFGYLVLNKLTHHITHKVDLRKRARKNPNIGDYSEAITSQNMEEALKLIKWVGDLRNIFFVIYDIFTKNKDTLMANDEKRNAAKEPESEPTEQTSFSEIL